MWESAGVNAIPQSEAHVVARQTGPLPPLAVDPWRRHAHLALPLQQEHVIGADNEFEAIGAATMAAKNARRKMETQPRADAEGLKAPSRQNVEMRARRYI
jgi:hypothetical protein